ncbi:hypothetical protein [Pseudomonas atacamensis]
MDTIALMAGIEKVTLPDAYFPSASVLGMAEIVLTLMLKLGFGATLAYDIQG